MNCQNTHQAQYTECKKNREEWIDIAKVLTMLLVVIGHSSYYTIKSQYGGFNFFENSQVKVSYTTHFINTLVGFIYQFHMPFFMAISGMTYAISYNPSRSFSSLIKKKANRLLLPFLMVTLFLSIPFKYISGYWDKSSDIFSDIFLGQILLFGNSHLWFIASLFIITITFTLLLRNGIFESHKITAIIVLVCISYMGLFLARTGQYFGIPGALKFMIFFVAGFYGLNRIRKFETGILFVIVGWIMTFALYIITNHISTYIKGFGTFMYLPLALAGCVNMVATAKILLKSSMLQKMYFYKSLRKYNYEIYLYSDPFNYLLISVFILMFGDRVLTGDLFSLTAFITRILFTILFAYVVIFMINKIAVISKSLGIKK